MKKHNPQYYLLLLLFVPLLYAGCKKDAKEEESIVPEETLGSIALSIAHKVDAAPLEFDTLKYSNQAGNIYKVSKLVYYISNLTFRNSDGSSYSTKNVYYIDAQVLSTTQFTLSDVPSGNYTSISFNIGIDSSRNIVNGLPATTENLSMEWPQPMGGGYHFLRLEGYYSDSCCTPGFAMHLGTNSCLVKVNINKNFTVSSSISSLQLNMNVNEWFKNPATYNFNTDGNFSMGNAAAMQKLTLNGVDVFN